MLRRRQRRCLEARGRPRGPHGASFETLASPAPQDEGGAFETDVRPSQHLQKSGETHEAFQPGAVSALDIDMAGMAVVDELRAKRLCQCLALGEGGKGSITARDHKSREGERLAGWSEKSRLAFGSRSQ